MQRRRLGRPRLGYWLVRLATAPLGFGLNSQIGGLIGRGGIFQLFENSTHHVAAGVEGCVLCGGRLGFPSEFRCGALCHWG